MRDYRHTLMGQEHGPSPLAGDRSEPQRIQLWREHTGQLCEIISIAEYEDPRSLHSHRIVVYRKYEPNGEVRAMPLVEFLGEVQSGNRFTREY